MLQDTQSVGLVCWGTKRGQEIFFNSPNISSGDDGMDRIIRDIRPVIRFDDANKDFYSLGFIRGLKVFTQYRSLYDWSNSSGGYLAISIFVPLGKRLGQIGSPEDPIDLLQNLLQIYLDRYIDSAYRISKEREDTTLFFDQLERIGVHDSSTEGWPESPANNQYASVYYNSRSDLKEYFHDPFRHEYKDYQSVFFLKKDLAPGKTFKSLTPLEVAVSEEKHNLHFTVKTEDENQFTRPIFKAFINGLKTNGMTLNDVRLSDQLRINVSLEGYTTIQKEGNVREWVKPNTVNISNHQIILEKAPYKVTFEVMNEKGKRIRPSSFFLNSENYDYDLDDRVILTDLFIGKDYELEIKEEEKYRGVKKKLKDYEITCGLVQIALMRKNEPSGKSTIRGSLESPNYVNNESSGSNKKSKVTFLRLAVGLGIVIILGALFFMEIIPNPFASIDPNVKARQEYQIKLDQIGKFANSINFERTLEPELIDSIGKSMELLEQQRFLEFHKESPFKVPLLTSKYGGNVDKLKDLRTHLEFTHKTIIWKGSNDKTNQLCLAYYYLKTIDKLNIYLHLTDKQKEKIKGWLSEHFQTPDKTETLKSYVQNSIKKAKGTERFQACETI